MIKIPCLFVRDFGARPPVLLPDVTPGCEWVLAGEGVATRKRDGTACAVIGGRLFKRYDAKASKPAPAGGIPCTPEPDPVTGHWPHWIAVGDEPDSAWHREAWSDAQDPNGGPPEGTYELCGPKIGGNPEGLDRHVFFRHGAEMLPAGTPCRSYDDLRLTLEFAKIEGIVFHHPDGRMAKIRRHDYGLAWGSKR